MDVRFYPSAPTAVGSLTGADPTCLGPLDYYHCNKFDGENMYMGMNDNNQEFLSANQTYNGQNENNEDYEIPPITPPNLPDPSLLHLVDHETGYHSLCHSLPPNSLIPAYSYQNMDLPAIMVSNMLSQDGHLLSSQLPTSLDCLPLRSMGLHRSNYLQHVGFGGTVHAKQHFALAHLEFHLEDCEDEEEHSSQCVLCLCCVDLQISDTKGCHMSGKLIYAVR